MRPTLIVGILLIVLGGISLAYQGIHYTTHKKILDVGPVQATAKQEKTLPLPPILGAVSLVAGLVLVVVGRRS